MKDNHKKCKKCPRKINIYKRYIDAEKLKRRIWDVPEFLLVSSSTKWDIFNFLNSAETEDVQPIIHGYWICSKSGLSACSHCKSLFVFSKTPNYCPECGASMKPRTEKYEH